MTFALQREIRRSGIDLPEFGALATSGGITAEDLLAWLRGLPTGLGPDAFANRLRNHGPDGSREATVRPLIDKAFRMARFSRALYHIACNLLAHEAGASFVLRGHFDGVRKYVRQPNRGEFRSFIMMAKDLGTIRLELKGGRVEQAPGETLGIRIFNFDFYIDLLDRGGLVH